MKIGVALATAKQQMRGNALLSSTHLSALEGRLAVIGAIKDRTVVGNERLVSRLLRTRLLHHSNKLKLKSFTAKASTAKVSLSI
ncbi:hypothetical protein O9992_06255 [Vibrio lentus]|nr:hypothetical protein [Vibrio lentus]